MIWLTATNTVILWKRAFLFSKAEKAFLCLFQEPKNSWTNDKTIYKEEDSKWVGKIQNSLLV